MTTVAIVQSNYIPWKGYLDLIGLSDTFVLLDDVQYTRRDWRNRNRIKTPQGLRWLTIPVETKGRYTQLIREVRISDPSWAEAHWQQLCQAYGKAPHFKQERAWLEPLYRQEAPRLTFLSEVNRLFLQAIMDRLGITTTLRDSSEFSLDDGKSERLLAICEQLGADRYLSGPAARGYLDVPLFARHGVAVEWMDYAGYEPYEQLHGGFDHGVTALDLLVHLGPAAAGYLKCHAVGCMAVR